MTPKIVYGLLYAAVKFGVRNSILDGGKGLPENKDAQPLIKIQITTMQLLE